MGIIKLLRYIINKINNPSKYVQNYEYDKDGLIPPFEKNIGGKNGRSIEKDKNGKNC